MTVIAWDGKTLAADKRCLSAWRAGTVTKLHGINNKSVAAIAGDLAKGMEMIQWLRDGAIPGSFPAAQRTSEYVLVAELRHGGLLYLYEGSPVPFRVEDKVWAGGSGRDFALMAMHLGHSAVDAVKLTSVLTQGCGNGVNSAWFERGGLEMR